MTVSGNADYGAGGGILHYGSGQNPANSNAWALLIHLFPKTQSMYPHTLLQRKHSQTTRIGINTSQTTLGSEVSFGVLLWSCGIDFIDFASELQNFVSTLPRSLAGSMLERGCADSLISPCRYPPGPNIGSQKA